MTPAPVNVSLWDCEDSTLSELSSQREWGLEDSGEKTQWTVSQRYRKRVFSYQINARSSDVKCGQRFPKSWLKRSKQGFFKRWYQTCSLHFQWLPAPHRVCWWTAAAWLSFHCRFLPCCRVRLCWPAAHRHRGKTHHKAADSRRRHRILHHHTAKNSYFPHERCVVDYWTPLFTVCLRVAPKNTSSLCP